MMTVKNLWLFLDKNERDAIVFHGLFTLLCAVVLVAPLPVKPGPRLLLLVMAYNLGFPLVARWRVHPDWIEVWGFALVMSLFQVFPDWFLAAQLKILVFPEDGLWKIGAVSSYMAGLWAIPFVVIILVGLGVERRTSRKAAYGAAGVAAFAIFVGSEQTLWLLSSWYAVNVSMIGHVAVYIVVPEVILGLCVYYGFTQVRQRSHWLKIPVAFLVMQLYLGSAALFYFVIEKVLQ